MRSVQTRHLLRWNKRDNYSLKPVCGYVATLNLSKTYRVINLCVKTRWPIPDANISCSETSHNQVAKKKHKRHIVSSRYVNTNEYTEITTQLKRCGNSVRTSCGFPLTTGSIFYTEQNGDLPKKERWRKTSGILNICNLHRAPCCSC